MANASKTVIVAAMDGTFQRKLFSSILELVPLAEHVANDTSEHRQWLQVAVDGFASLAHCDGEGMWCAFREELNHEGWGGSTKVPDNSDYGTFESPLNQENGDPVSDFLYTSNFALLGLHEAAAATGNATIKALEDRLANYLVRIQAKSTEHPGMDGAYFRAFDYEKWEAWASDADIGWGAWSIETGWTQTWITTTFGMRLLNTSLWDLGASINGIDQDFATWTTVMFPPPPPPPPPPPCLPGTPDAGGHVQFNLTNDLGPLCAPPGGKVTTLYLGQICHPIEVANGSGPFILWDSMKTLDPRHGVEKCQWSRTDDPGDIDDYFGSCGVPATQVPLPIQYC